MKRFKQLDKRLTAIAELTRLNAIICDVGTDHAQLACHLARSGKYGQVYASDLNPNPLKFAKSQIEYQDADVVLIQSDGLEKVPPPPSDADCDVIIAGMGGELIAEIIGKMPSGFISPRLRIIAQPMTRQEHLRQWVKQSGFEILLEKSVIENHRKFVIIYIGLGVSK
ncbi:MAG: class I SAM-dependent methyltransferase [Oscillospiraceae bacterium]|nr:class I SAM-dependent methyltransferase [Oscillospiraceae bacterium]